MAGNNLSNRYFRIILALLVVGGIGAVLVWIYRLNLLNSLDHYNRVFSDKEAIKELLKSWGPWAPMAYIFFQAAQVLFAPLPGEATGAVVAGYFFGVYWGTLYSLVGLVVGSVVAFLLGSWLEHRLVAKVVPHEIIERFHKIAETKGLIISLVIFALPYFPKDYFCFLLGMSEMSLGIFLFVVTIGRLPGALMFSLQGAQISKGEYHHFLILTGIYILLAFFLYMYRQRLYRWIKTLSKHKK